MLVQKRAVEDAPSLMMRLLLSKADTQGLPAGGGGLCNKALCTDSRRVKDNTQHYNTISELDSSKC